MNFKNELSFALDLDTKDELHHLKNLFIIPRVNGEEAIYLCGNSLGLQPKGVAAEIEKQLSAWGSLGVEGWFKGTAPWLNYHHHLAAPLAAIVGAEEDEVTVMNSLTVNLHLLMVSFYQPNAKRFKILMEGGAFPSDQYAVASQVNFHGFDPQEVIIEISPRPGEYTLRTEDIVDQIKQNGDELALVLFGGVNYYTGQYFDIEAITAATHRAGAFAGFDLAHAAGNVPLNLHDWGVDFACWCSYKYMNSGPGGISGIFVHQKHFDDNQLQRLAGWWGNREDERFFMKPVFEPGKGASGWQVSTSPVMLLAIHQAALDVFQAAGGLKTLREKSEQLTAYLEFIIVDINKKLNTKQFNIITPGAAGERGCQLSIICKQNGREIFSYLEQNGVIGDWREPNVIRLSPVPLYNTFKDVFLAGQLLYRFFELHVSQG
jgi:kynureninase